MKGKLAYSCFAFFSLQNQMYGDRDQPTAAMAALEAKLHKYETRTRYKERWALTDPLYLRAYVCYLEAEKRKAEDSISNSLALLAKRSTSNHLMSGKDTEAKIAQIKSARASMQRYHAKWYVS